MKALEWNQHERLEFQHQFQNMGNLGIVSTPRAYINNIYWGRNKKWIVYCINMSCIDASRNNLQWCHLFSVLHKVLHITISSFQHNFRKIPYINKSMLIHCLHYILLMKLFLVFCVAIFFFSLFWGFAHKTYLIIYFLFLMAKCYIVHKKNEILFYVFILLISIVFI